jgi:hypothetical protein
VDIVSDQSTFDSIETFWFSKGMGVVLLLANCLENSQQRHWCFNDAGEVPKDSCLL